MEKSEIVIKASRLLVTHFRNLIDYGEAGFNTRIFKHMLHPEEHFVFAGTSISVTSDSLTHPEHVVPCAVLINECKRLIKNDAHSDGQIAILLAKHWKIVKITKEEQQRVDYELGYKSKMPDGWCFENGDTFERLHRANIVLKIQAITNHSLQPTAYSGV